MSHKKESLAKPVNSPEGRMTIALCTWMGLTQEQIARKLSLSFSTVHNWTKDKKRARETSLVKLGGLFKSSINAQESSDTRVQSILSQLYVDQGQINHASCPDPLDELFRLLIDLKSSNSSGSESFVKFRKKYSPWSNLVSLEESQIQSFFHQEGLGSLKARAFIAIAKQLKKKFGVVSLKPLSELGDHEAEELLMNLSGIGQVTARMVLTHCFDKDVLPADGDTYRVASRLSMVKPQKSTKDIHTAFDRAIPKGLAKDLHIALLTHGRKVCTAQTPKCSDCVLSLHCPTGRKVLDKPKTMPHSSASNNKRVLPNYVNSQIPVVIDIYAGCGGLSLGFKQAGFNVAYSLDWDKDACETHDYNFPDTLVEETDVREVSAQDIVSRIESQVDVVIGGPNCQGVSERGLRNPDDPRNFMFPEFSRLIEELQPAYFLMENVPGITHRHNFALLKEIFSCFKNLGYQCAADVLLAAHYGVPQLRNRFILIGTRTGNPITFPAPTHSLDRDATLFSKGRVSAWDAISDLPDIDANHQDTQSMHYKHPPETEYQRYIRGNAVKVFNHFCSATRELNLERASHIPEGGNWKDIPPELLPPRFFNCRMTDHSTTYARLRRDEPAFTVTTLFGNITSGAFTHPTNNRALSIREGARLQSFPDDFIFKGPRNSQYRQIGNAVPPLLARHIGSHILSSMKGERVPSIEPRITNEVLADEKAWDALPVLTPRYKGLFGTGTRWPKGWGKEPKNYDDLLDKNYKLKEEFKTPSS